MEQTGGVNTAAYLSIGPGGQYQFSGGTLQLSGVGLVTRVSSTPPARRHAEHRHGIADLSQGPLQNVGSLSVTVGGDGLLLLPAGFNPASFASLAPGLVHVAGTPLSVSAGQGFTGAGSIGDPVTCQGTIAAASGFAINLTNGLVLPAGGSVILGSNGNLTVNDAASGQGGGTLSVSNQYVGSGGTGTFTQSGGTNTVSSNLYLGNAATDNGTYALNGPATLSATTQYVGYSGTGTFSQSAGTNALTNGYVSLYLGYNTTGAGSYSLSGSGSLSAYEQYVGNSGTGTFSQSGGTNGATYLELGVNSGASGTYNLSGSGQLSAMTESIGLSGTGTFTQTGGMNTVSYNFYVGGNSTGPGTYNLSAGKLSAPNENHQYRRKLHAVGRNQRHQRHPGAERRLQSQRCEPVVRGHRNPQCRGPAAQTGGANTATTLSIASGGDYLFSGGTLQVGGSLTNLGTFDGGGRAATLIGGPSAIVNLSQGTLQNTGSLSVSMGANSLLLLPAGFNTATGFGSYSSLGLTHDLGTTLTVPAGTSISGSLTLNDPVICQGTLAASGGNINLNNGLIVSGNGNVSLASGSLTVNDATSGVSGRSLSLYNLYAGNGGSGTFTQSGGAIVLQNAYYDGNLYLGYNFGRQRRLLPGAGKLTVANNTYVGYNGTGTFTQSGGTNTGEGIPGLPVSGLQLGQLRNLHLERVGHVVQRWRIHRRLGPRGVRTVGRNQQHRGLPRHQFGRHRDIHPERRPIVDRRRNHQHHRQRDLYPIGRDQPISGSLTIGGSAGANGATR